MSPAQTELPPPHTLRRRRCACACYQLPLLNHGIYIPAVAPPRRLGLSGVRHHGLLDDDMGVVVAPGKYNFSKIIASWKYQKSLGVVSPVRTHYRSLPTRILSPQQAPLTELA